MFHPRILRALVDKLARPLTHIFNNSVESGIINEDWKSANVTEIHKKGSSSSSSSSKDRWVHFHAGLQLFVHT